MVKHNGSVTLVATTKKEKKIKKKLVLQLAAQVIQSCKRFVNIIQTDYSHTKNCQKKNCPHWKCPFSFYTEFKEPWTSCKCKTWTAVRHKKTANWQKKTSWKTRNIITCVGQADANYGKKIKYSFGTFKLVTNQPEA